MNVSTKLTVYGDEENNVDLMDREPVFIESDGKHSMFVWIVVGKSRRKVIYSELMRAIRNAGDLP